MRKFILIAAMVLVSASAQAGPSRNLTVAANDETAKVAQPKAVPDKVVQDKTVQDKATQDKTATQVDEQGVETPKYVERPAAVAKTVEPAKADQVKTVADKDAAAPKASSIPSDMRRGTAPRPSRGCARGRSATDASACTASPTRAPRNCLQRQSSQKGLRALHPR